MRRILVVAGVLALVIAAVAVVGFAGYSVVKPQPTLAAKEVNAMQSKWAQKLLTCQSAKAYEDLGPVGYDRYLAEIMPTEGAPNTPLQVELSRDGFNCTTDELRRY
jgi:hypothetical protein